MFISCLIIYVTYTGIPSDIVPRVQVANVTFRNPYSRVGIHVYKIDANLMYQGQRFGTTAVDGFYLRHKKEKSNVNVVLSGEQVLQLINGNEMLVYASETKNGVYNIGVKVRLAMRSRAMWSDNYEQKFEFMCDKI
ncbi:NDR1/HIN1-like protein 2 [Rutidosis leptorrhynchoides]|uniref:NDR1/HIN1-like protein 2 n=1 Tax=Rutidosis leptorrhynchoides TaxID=125765 RepID=UPI003A99912D